MLKELLSNPGNLSCGLFRMSSVLIDFSPETKDTLWAALDTRLFGRRTSRATPGKPHLAFYGWTRTCTCR